MLEDKSNLINEILNNSVFSPESEMVINLKEHLGRVSSPNLKLLNAIIKAKIADFVLDMYNKAKIQ